MALINPDLSGIVDGSQADAIDVSNPLNTIIDEINGGLDNDNLATSAGIVWTKMAATALTDWGSSLNATGFSSTSTEASNYIQYGKMVFMWVNIIGTSDATTLTFTLPVAAKRSDRAFGLLAQDNGSNQTDPGRINFSAGSTTATALKNHASAAWTASSTKGIVGYFMYEAA